MTSSSSITSHDIPNPQGRILIINNSTKHLQELENLLIKLGYNIMTITQGQLQQVDITQFDAIVLSGGSQTRSVMNHSEDYQKEIDYVRTCEKPIIGICLGAQIIAKAFGSEIVHLEHKIDEVIDIGNGRGYKVKEAHEYAISKLGHELVELARSVNGIELFKHKSKTIYGMQFHPECFVSELDGDDILKNILDKIVYQDYDIIKLPIERRQEYRDLKMEMAKYETSAFDINYEELLQKEQEYRTSWILGKNDRILYFIQDKDEKILGTINYKIRPERTSAGIYGMYIKKEYRGRGLSKLLLRFVMNELAKLGVTEMKLKVFSSQSTALKLYEVFGFTITSQGKEDKGRQYCEMTFVQPIGPRATLHFYGLENWNHIKSGKKCIETRALNPHEPERYFGNIQIDDLVQFQSIDTGEIILVRISHRYLWENFEQLSQESDNVLKNIRPNEDLTTLRDVSKLKLLWDYEPGYIDSIQQHGLIGRGFEIVS